jgi:hypothetical protein
VCHAHGRWCLDPRGSEDVDRLRLPSGCGRQPGLDDLYGRQVGTGPPGAPRGLRGGSGLHKRRGGQQRDELPHLHLVDGGGVDVDARAQTVDAREQG